MSQKIVELVVQFALFRSNRIFLTRYWHWTTC